MPAKTKPGLRQPATTDPIGETLRALGNGQQLHPDLFERCLGDNVDLPHFSPNSDEYGGPTSKGMQARIEKKLAQSIALNKKGKSMTFTKAHPSEAHLISAAKGTFCPYNALRSGVLVCVTKAVRQRWIEILNKEKEKQYQDPMTPSTEDQVLLVNQLVGREFQEVFLSAEFGPDTPRGILHQVFSSARVGLHLVRSSRH
jgi:hypothetical protein